MCTCASSYSSRCLALKSKHTVKWKAVTICTPTMIITCHPGFCSVSSGMFLFLWFCCGQKGMKRTQDWMTDKHLCQKGSHIVRLSPRTHCVGSQGVFTGQETSLHLGSWKTSAEAGFHAVVTSYTSSSICHKLVVYEKQIFKLRASHDVRWLLTWKRSPVAPSFSLCCVQVSWSQQMTWRSQWGWRIPLGSGMVRRSHSKVSVLLKYCFILASRYWNLPMIVWQGGLTILSVADLPHFREKKRGGVDQTRVLGLCLALPLRST